MADKRIFLYTKDIEELEGISDKTAGKRFDMYLQMVGKKRDTELTVFEYAVLRNCLVEEICVALNIKTDKWDWSSIHIIIEKIKARMERIKNKKADK